jgi:hypothetical protein
MDRAASWEQLGFIGSQCVVAVVAATGLVGRGFGPLLWVCVVAGGVAILAGPIRWLIQPSVSSEQRERYEYAAYIGFGLAVPAVVAALLLTGSVMYKSYILTLGGLIGYAVVVLSERAGLYDPV